MRPVYSYIDTFVFENEWNAEFELYDLQLEW